MTQEYVHIKYKGYHRCIVRVFIRYLRNTCKIVISQILILSIVFNFSTYFNYNIRYKLFDSIYCTDI